MRIVQQSRDRNTSNLRTPPFRFGAGAPALIVAVVLFLIPGAASAHGVPTSALSHAAERIRASEAGDRIPYFARQYGTSCTTCHVTPAKLNQFGEDFLARGYRFPTPRERNRTIPLAVWASARGDWLPGPARNVPHLNRVEILSGGTIFKSAWSYFVEWRAVSFGAQSDGTLKDRSGRFEDLFVQRDLAPGVQLMVGQFRLLSQVDVSRRLSLSEPAAFSVALPGDSARPRLESLRGFKQSGRSPALRLQLHRGPDRSRSADGWYLVGNLAFPGEFSIPLTEEAGRNASFEFEERPKGGFFEAYYRRGLNSIGLHTFIGGGRWLAGAVGTYNSGPWFSTLAVTVARRGTSEGRWTWDNEWIPNPWAAFGLRIEDRTGEGLEPVFAPYVSTHWPGTRYTFRLSAEHRIQRGRPAKTAIELATIF